MDRSGELATINHLILSRAAKLIGLDSFGEPLGHGVAKVNIESTGEQTVVLRFQYTTDVETSVNTTLVSPFVRLMSKSDWQPKH